jgi:purine nucleoside permease
VEAQQASLKLAIFNSTYLTQSILMKIVKKLILSLSSLSCLWAAAGACAADNAANNVATAAAPRPVKVVIVSMFGPEAEPWIKPMALNQVMHVPGLSGGQGSSGAEFQPKMLCNSEDVCLLMTGMGHTNAAASTLALTLDPQFDLRKTYFLIAGIAGIDPAQGTIGSAAWARYLVDFGIAHEIDAREMPKGWPVGYFGIFTKGPGKKPKFDYRTEAFQLDEPLLQKVLALTRDAKLEDSDKARAYRAHYKSAPANAPPRVIQCDTLAGDTWWHGKILGEHARAWTRTLTDGKGVYCTTQQEDNATFNALARAADAGKVELRRLAVLRTGVNFDRPYPGQSAYASLTADSGGFLPATNNLYHVGGIVVRDIVSHWAQWRDGVPAP